MKYHIEFSDQAIQHLKYLSAAQRSTILRAIERQLSVEPFKKARNRKLLRPNSLAPWELRVGMLRAFYQPSEDTANEVQILAIGLKKGNILFIAGKAVIL